MARVSGAFLKQYPLYKMEELKDPVVFIVDMVNGFVKEGALHDTAIHAVTPTILSFLKECACRTIFVADSHPSNAKEFASFPPHCVEGTSESEVVEELQPYIREVFHKNSTNTFHCNGFQEFLKDIRQYKDIVITGCCSDICIMQFALTLQSWLNEHNCFDMQILVPIAMIETYHMDGIHDAVEENEFSIRNMAASGIQIVQTIEGRR